MKSASTNLLPYHGPNLYPHDTFAGACWNLSTAITPLRLSVERAVFAPVAARLNRLAQRLGF